VIVIQTVSLTEAKRGQAVRAGAGKEAEPGAPSQTGLPAL